MLKFSLIGSFLPAHKYAGTSPIKKNSWPQFSVLFVLLLCLLLGYSPWRSILSPVPLPCFFSSLQYRFCQHPIFNTTTTILKVTSVLYLLVSSEISSFFSYQQRMIHLIPPSSLINILHMASKNTTLGFLSTSMVATQSFLIPAILSDLLMLPAPGLNSWNSLHSFLSDWFQSPPRPQISPSTLSSLSLAVSSFQSLRPKTWSYPWLFKIHIHTRKIFTLPSTI